MRCTTCFVLPAVQSRFIKRLTKCWNNLCWSLGTLLTVGKISLCTGVILHLVVFESLESGVKKKQQRARLSGRVKIAEQSSKKCILVSICRRKKKYTN